MGEHQQEEGRTQEREDDQQEFYNEEVIYPYFLG